MIEVVIDTNVFVSALIGGKISSTILQYIKDEKLYLVISPQMLGELIHVLYRPKFRLSKIDISKIIVFLENRARFVDPTEKILSCRDPKDNKVLECAVAGKVDYIITSDPDLLVLDKFRDIPIITPLAFIKLN